MIPEKPTVAGEIWGGLASMLVALPSAIAFGLIIYAPLGPDWAGRGALAGIVGTVVLGLIVPALGGTPRLITAPCAPAAAVMAALAADLALHVPAARIPLLLALAALLAGAVQLFFGAIRGGRFVKYIPYPVVTGYLSGVGVLIFIGQLPKLLGLPAGTHLWEGLTSPGLWNRPAVVVGVVTIAVTALGSRITRKIPAAILGLGAGLLSYLCLSVALPDLAKLDGNPLVIGRVGASGESIVRQVGDRWSGIGGIGLADLARILVPALTLAVLLSIDTLKTCVIVDALTRSRHKSDRELIGQGLGNAASALVGGVPGAGTMGATLINLHSGGATRLSGTLEGVFALAVFAALGGLVAWMPVAALAGILIVVASKMVDRTTLHLLRRRSTHFDFLVVAAVVVTAVAVNLIAAAGAGLALAIFLFLREQIRSSVVRRKSYGNLMFSKKRRLPEELAVLEKHGARTAICELQGSLFFGTTDQLFTELEPDLKACDRIVLDLRRVQSVDFTAAHMLQQIESQLADRKGHLLLSHLPPHLPTGQHLESYFGEVGLVKPTRNVRIFDRLDDALEWAEERLLEESETRVKREAPLEIGEIDLLKGLDAEALAALAGLVTERSVEAGQKIFSQGDAGDEVFLIRRGNVRILLPLAGGGQHHLVTFGRGDFFGDMAFLDRSARSADAVASTPADLYVLSRARFDEAAPAHGAMARKVLSRMARALAMRLRQTDAEVRALLEEE